MAYSDAADTQVFHVSLGELKITKLTSKACAKNGISTLPVAKKLRFITDMYTKELYLVFITEDFKVIKMAVDKDM